MMTEGGYYDDRLMIIVWYLVLNLVVPVIFLVVLVMMTEAEYYHEKFKSWRLLFFVLDGFDSASDLPGNASDDEGEGG